MRAGGGFEFCRHGSSFASRDECRNPDLVVGVVGIAFAIPATKGWADSLDLDHVGQSASLIEGANQFVTLLIDVWCNLAHDLSSIPAQSDATVKAC
jgi:hypothetical protein